MMRRATISLAVCTLLTVAARGMPPSPVRQEEPMRIRFDGKKYENSLVPSHSLSEIWSHLWNRGGSWPSRVVVPPGPKPPERVAGGGLRITWVNHSTMLIQMDGMNILTDPIWSRTAGRWGMGVTRVGDPGIRFEELPPLDVVLLSHNHYDHLDVPTLRRIAKTHGCPIITPSRNGEFLRKKGIGPVRELDWWESLEVRPGLSVKALPARHWSQRGLWDRDRALWCSFAITGASGSVFFAGDTGFGDHFAQIRQACGPFRAALLPIGTYEPRAFMASSHINPEEAVRAAETLEAQAFVPMHYGTFNDGGESYDAPLRDLSKTLAERPILRGRLHVLKGGEGADLP